MKKDKQVRSYTRKSKTGKVVTVRAHKATYDAAEEQKKMASKEGSGNELSKKKLDMMENPLGFSKDEYKEWYHWDLDNDPNNESALKVEKALQKHMGKKAYNKYFDDMSDSYTKTGHTKAHKALMDDHAAKQKKRDAEIAKASRDIVAGAKQKAESTKDKAVDYSTLESSKKDIQRAAKALGVTEREAASWMEGPNWKEYKASDLKKVDKLALKFLKKKKSEMDASGSDIPRAVMTKLDRLEPRYQQLDSVGKFRLYNRPTTVGIDPTVESYDDSTGEWSKANLIFTHKISPEVHKNLFDKGYKVDNGKLIKLKGRELAELEKNSRLYRAPNRAPALSGKSARDTKSSKPKKEDAPKKTEQKATTSSRSKSNKVRHLD